MPVADEATPWAEGGSDADNPRLRLSKRFVRLALLFFVVAIGWSYVALLDEVSTGTGKVVPTMQ